MDENLIIRCECHSLDHIAEFSLFTYPETNDISLYLAVHLHTWKNFFRRLWLGLRYAFGYKCRYGNWDEMLISVEEAKKIVAVCNKFIEYKSL